MHFPSELTFGFLLPKNKEECEKDAINKLCRTKPSCDGFSFHICETSIPTLVSFQWTNGHNMVHVILFFLTLVIK
jgi:hypothetical protein